MRSIWVSGTSIAYSPFYSAERATAARAQDAVKANKASRQQRSRKPKSRKRSADLLRHFDLRPGWQGQAAIIASRANLPKYSCIRAGRASIYCTTTFLSCPCVTSGGRQPVRPAIIASPGTLRAGSSESRVPAGRYGPGRGCLITFVLKKRRTSWSVEPETMVVCGTSRPTPGNKSRSCIAAWLCSLALRSFTPRARPHHLSRVPDRCPQRRQNSAGLHRLFQAIDPALALSDDGARVLDVVSSSA